jgi:negative regulator of flagellin synthesis FlgM
VHADFSKVPGIRHELVKRIRREIAAGAYDTPAKLETAVERMLSRLADD